LHASKLPKHNGLLDWAVLHCVDDTDRMVLCDAADFAQKDKYLPVMVSFIAGEMFNEGGAWVAITINIDTLICAVGNERQDISLLDIPVESALVTK
jgi:hypothetical protein